jgi:hypothetical protein
MRCYFLANGRIGAVEQVTDASDEAAIEQAKLYFVRRKDKCSGFEAWDRQRLVSGFPAAPPKYTS